MTQRDRVERRRPGSELRYVFDSDASLSSDRVGRGSLFVIHATPPAFEKSWVSELCKGGTVGSLVGGHISIVRPHEVRLGLLLDLVLVQFDPPTSQRAHQLHHLLGFPLGGDEAALGLWGRRHGVDVIVVLHPVDVLGEGVDFHVRELALSYPLHHVHLCVGPDQGERVSGAAVRQLVAPQSTCVLTQPLTRNPPEDGCITTPAPQCTARGTVRRGRRGSSDICLSCYSSWGYSVLKIICVIVLGSSSSAVGKPLYPRSLARRRCGFLFTGR